MEEKLKILVADAEAESGELISRIAADISGTDVLDIAVNGRITLAKLRRFPAELVLLDLAIPDMNLVDVTRKVRKNHPDTQVIVLCSRVETRVDEIVEALEAGAIDFMPKPVSANENSIREFRLRLMTIIGLLRSRRNFRMAEQISAQRSDGFNDAAVPVTAAADIFRKRPDFFVPDQERCKSAGPAVIPVRIDAVAIAVSTGGPNALAQVIPQLPRDLGVPVLIVQHIPRLFTASLANSLNAKSAIAVKEAAEGEKVMPNIAYIAPGGRHLVIRKEKNIGISPLRRYIGLNSDPPENSVRPSADVLFRSLAIAYSGTVLPVIMTGMGCDGMKGVLSLKAKGCYCLSQTAETCTVYGMPRSVDDAGLSDERVPLGQLAARITAIIKSEK